MPMNTLADTASEVGPLMPMVRRKIAAKAVVIHFRMPQCQSIAESAATTMISGRIWKKKDGGTRPSAVVNGVKGCATSVLSPT